MNRSENNDDADSETLLNRANEKEALLRLLVWAYNRLEELEALEASEHVASAIERLKVDT